MKKTSPSQFYHCIEGGITECCEVTWDGHKPLEDVNGNGNFWVTFLLPIVTLDTPDDPLDNRGFTQFKWETCINVHGTNTGDVGFNGFGHDPVITEEANPFKYPLSSWEELPRLDKERGANLYKVDIGVLTRQIVLPIAGCEAMP